MGMSDSRRSCISWDHEVRVEEQEEAGRTAVVIVFAVSRSKVASSAGFENNQK
jgi:hypothetical protein